MLIFFKINHTQKFLKNLKTIQLNLSLTKQKKAPPCPPRRFGQ